MSSSTLDNFPAFLLSGNGMKHQKNTKKLIDNHKIPIPILPTSSSRGYESSGPSRELENAHIFVLSSGLTGHQIILDRSGPDPFPCRPCQPFLSIQSAQVKRGEWSNQALVCVCVHPSSSDQDYIDYIQWAHSLSSHFAPLGKSSQNVLAHSLHRRYSFPIDSPARGAWVKDFLKESSTTRKHLYKFHQFR